LLFGDFIFRFLFFSFKTTLPGVIFMSRHQYRVTGRLKPFDTMINNAAFNVMIWIDIDV